MDERARDILRRAGYKVESNQARREITVLRGNYYTLKDFAETRGFRVEPLEPLPIMAYAHMRVAIIGPSEEKIDRFLQEWEDFWKKMPSPSSSEVPLKLLKDLVERTITDLSAREGVAPLEVRWTAETFYRKPVLFVAMIPSIMGGPFLTFPAWPELALKESYEKFEPYIRYIIAHEFKHYLQDLAGMYKKQDEMWKEGKFFDYPFEEEAYEYADRYTGMTKREYLRLGDEATEIIKREAKAGVRVVA